MKKKSRLWIFIVGGIVLGLCGMGLLGAGLVGIATGGGEEPATEAERALLLTVDDLAPYFGRELGDASATERVGRVGHFDGSLELVYEYEYEGVDDALFVQSGIAVERSAAAARQVYAGMGLGMGLGLAMEGGEITQRESDHMLRWGDASRCTIMMDGERPIGNFFVARSGRYVFHFIVAGVYFDDAETFRELIEPHLEGMLTYEP